MGLDSTAADVSFERQGLGASTGLTLLGVPGDGRERPALLVVEGESPSFGFGARGGLCMSEEKTKQNIDTLEIQAKSKIY